MTQPYVLAFVGENANGILDWWTGRIMHGFARHGLHHRIIDVTDPDWRARLADTLIAGQPEFCFSFQGFGMDLRLGNDNYWSLNRIPFFSYLGDSPYHNPALHNAEGEGLYLLYGCEDFLDTYRRHMGGRAYATTVRYGYPENPGADAAPWGQRDLGILFVKSGVDPDRLSSAWNALPPPIRAILHEASDQALSGADSPIADLCAAAFTRAAIHWGDRRELFLFVCSTVDRYVRATRADRMVRHLMRHDATIVGDWSHLDRAGARARFCNPVSAEALGALYANARIVVNTSPSVRRGMHERIMAGLFAKAAVVSDTTPFLQQTLIGCPSFHGLDIDADSFGDQLDDALGSAAADSAMPCRIAASFETARALFSFDDFIQALVDFRQMEAHRRVIQPWAFPPARGPAPAAAPQDAA
jgi:hypothetical protein